MSEPWSTRVLTTCFQKTFIRQIAEPVEVALSKAKPDMWDNVLRAFRESLEQCETTYLSKAKSKWSSNPKRSRSSRY